MSAPRHFDRDEMTRPGHVPSLITDRYGMWASCSCGWTLPPCDSFPTADLTAAMWGHVADVDSRSAT